MEDRIYIEIEPIAVATGDREAIVLTKLVGVRNAQDRHVYDLFATDDDGEPIGECIGRSRASEAEPGPSVPGT